MGRVPPEFRQRLQRPLARGDQVVAHFDHETVLAGEGPGGLQQATRGIEDRQHALFGQHLAQVIGEELFEAHHSQRP